jgi:hypothetical protein
MPMAARSSAAVANTASSAASMRFPNEVSDLICSIVRTSLIAWSLLTARMAPVTSFWNYSRRLLGEKHGVAFPYNEQE